MSKRNNSKKAMRGSLVCVGTGTKLGAHITPIAKSHIEHANVVFSLVSHGITQDWIAQMNTDVRDLQPFYGIGKSRSLSYQQMIQAIVDEVKLGKKVVGAFYGHPSVFADVPHRAIEQVRELGLDAYMEAGVSAEDCLYADLLIDPGRSGCIHYETSQFMFYQRNLDTAAHLVLWQIGTAGDRSLEKYTTSSKYRELLVKMLSEHYPLDHQVILYEAAITSLHKMRADKIPLSELPKAEVSQITTLVIPPCTKMKKNQAMLDELAKLDKRDKFTLVTN